MKFILSFELTTIFVTFITKSKPKEMKNLLIKDLSCYIFSISFLFVLKLIMINSVYGQDRKFSRYSISPYVGVFGTNTNNSGFHYGAELSVEKSSFIYSCNFTKMDEFSILGPSPKEYYNQIGFLIGRGVARGKKLQAHIKAGMSSTWGLRRTEEISSGIVISHYETEKFSTVGLLATAGFRIAPKNWIGFGFDIQGNFAPKISTGLYILSVNLGRLW